MKVGEARRGASDRRRRARPAAAENLRVGQKREPELTPDKAPSGRCHRKHEPLRRHAGLEPRGFAPSQKLSLALGLATMGESHDHIEPLAPQAEQLVLGLAEAARGECRTLRVERERLTLGQWVELRHALERLIEPLVAPDAAHLVGPPDEIDGRRERGDEGDTRPTRVELVFAVERRLGPVGAPLRGRIDGRLRHLSEGALRVGRKRADRLDLVSEEIDPQRLAAGTREHVEQTSADRELTALLDPFDALVAREGELRCQPGDPGSGPAE